MANRTKASASNDQVSTSTTKSRSNSKQQNTSVKEVNDDQLQQKKEMQLLNDRFAVNSSKIRELQKEKQNLIDQIQFEKENCEAKIEECRLYYETQLNQLREKLDLECQNSAKKTIDYEKYKQLVKEAERERNVLLNDLKQIDKRNNLLAADVDKLKERLNTLTAENEQLHKSVQNLEHERNSLDKTSKKHLAQAETENLRAISLEGKLKALEEKISSQKHFYEKELEETRLRFEEERDEIIEEAIQNEVEAYKVELDMRARRDREQNITKVRQELERQHADELLSLRDQLNRAKTNDNLSRSKLNGLQTLIDKLNAKIQELNQNETRLHTKVAELEGIVELERNEKLELINEKEREIRELEEELSSKDSENQQVVDNNVQLKEEIRIYRNLLDEQEKSLESGEINASIQRTRASSPSGGRRFAQAARKRKRLIDQVDETTIVNNSVGPIAIDESTDQFIRLVNRSPNPVPLGGWELKRENGDEGFAFKFHKSVVVQPNETVTVYSMDAENAAHNPPVEIKLKKNWPIAGITTLSNPSKEEIARWELSSNTKRIRINGSADDEANRSCCLM